MAPQDPSTSSATAEPAVGILPARRARGGADTGPWSHRLRWMLLGFALSMPIHAVFVVWMAMVRVDRPGTPAPGDPSIVDVTFVPEGDVPSTVIGSSAGGSGDGPVISSPGAPAAEEPAATGLEGGPGVGTGLADGGVEGFGVFGRAGGGGGGTGIGGAGSGAGGGSGGGLGGGAGGTSFFGVGGTGTRFAFIVDKSGSMGGGRLEEAKEELRKSVAGLPDYASVYVSFFDSAPPWIFSDKWERVRSSTLQKLARWLRDVGASGGTQPMGAFRQVFALDTRPDVIFFLSDGEIPEESVGEIRRLNSRGKKVVIHAIAFGDEAGSARLRQVAAEADGEFREVKPRGPGARP
ncbi:MAG: VWA domain-containing protein [Phycisphaerales bacterium]